MKTRMLFSMGIVLSLAGHSRGAGLPSPLIQNVTNAPNPFDSRRGGLEGQTRISYQLAADSTVHVRVYDLFGFKVRQWDFSANDEGGRAGLNDFLWDGTNATGQKVSKGGYLVSIDVENAQGHSQTLRKVGVIH